MLKLLVIGVLNSQNRGGPPAKLCALAEPPCPRASSQLPRSLQTTTLARGDIAKVLVAASCDLR